MTIEELLKKKEDVEARRTAFANELHELAYKEGDKFSVTDSEKCDELQLQIDQCGRQIGLLDQDLEKANKVRRTETLAAQDKFGAPTLNNALLAFARGGMKGMTAEQKEIWEVGEANFSQYESGMNVDKMDVDDDGIRLVLDTASHRARAPQAATVGDKATAASQGTKVIYTEWGTDVVHALASFGGIRQMCRSFPTARGNDYPYPQMSNETVEGERIGSQGTAAAVKDINSPTQVIFKAFTYSSRQMAISRELIQDAAVDLVQIILEEGYRRIGRITNKEFTNGAQHDGTTPYGLKIASKAGITTASNTAITFNELLTLEHKVEAAYRMGMETPDGRDGGRMARMGQVGFMLHDSMLLQIKQMKDTQGRPLFLPNIRVGAPATIHGFPFAINQNLDAVAASAVPMLFGHFGYFAVRDVTGIDVFRFTDSAFMTKNTIGFLMFIRCDARPLGPLASNLLQTVAKCTLKA